jgi:hypothetical protein
MAYIRWAVMTFQPLSTCEDPYFRAMCAEAGKNTPPVYHKKVTDQMKQTACFCKVTLAAVLVGLYYALTTDHWTSIANVAYMATTIHFITDDWELISFTLSCTEHDGTQTAPDILKELEATWLRYELSVEHLMAVVTDTAPVMCAFGKELKEKFDVYHIYCADHVLELTTVRNLPPPFSHNVEPDLNPLPFFSPTLLRLYIIHRAWPSTSMGLQNV